MKKLAALYDTGFHPEEMDSTAEGEAEERRLGSADDPGSLPGINSVI